jgi:hypothetical protein
MKKAWYVRFTAQIGPGSIAPAATYLCSEFHPMAPTYFKQWTSKAASQITLSTGAIIQPEAILIEFLYELPLEVAKARYPQEILQ